MKIGIDSYCFHRYFGEIYEGTQTDPGTRWQMEREFLDFALAQQIDEVALESCFFDALDDGLCAEIKGRLDDAGLDRVLGWGHPEGLWGGTKPEELEALKRHLPQVRKLGSTRMRICAASMNYAKAPREELYDLHRDAHERENLLSHTRGAPPPLAHAPYAVPRPRA